MRDPERDKQTDAESAGTEGDDQAQLLARLAGGLAHEIKNPLSTMAINLTLLEEEFQPAPGGDGGQSPAEKRSSKRINRCGIQKTKGCGPDYERHHDP